MNLDFMKLRDWIPNKKLKWHYLSSNINAISLLEKNIDKIDWMYLSMNPNAIHLLEKNMDKIDWDRLSRNSNKNAFSLLEKNIDKVNWSYLSKNSSAIHLLEKNINKIDWYELSSNPSIFTYNYEMIKKHNDNLKNDLVEYLFHPRFCHKWHSWGHEDCEDFVNVRFE